MRCPLESFEVPVVLAGHLIGKRIPLAIVLRVDVKALRVAWESDVWLDRRSKLSMQQCVPIYALEKGMRLDLLSAAN